MKLSVGFKKLFVQKIFCCNFKDEVSVYSFFEFCYLGLYEKGRYIRRTDFS